MHKIEIEGLTKDYGEGRGIFDLSFHVAEGEVFGFLGPNGAGKTTTIRHLMGFTAPQKGSCSMDGMKCRENAAEIMKNVGYLPGEIAFMDDMTGIGFIRFMAELRRMKDFALMEELTERFELDARGRLKKMSKGMKQKIGIVCAFMHDPGILILDEPTSGLDPLMQSRFIELILEEKKKGKTILMSSHMFEEVERTCDRIGIIKRGKLIAVEDAKKLQESKQKLYCITLDSGENAEEFAKEAGQVKEIEGNRVTIAVTGDIMPLIHTMGSYRIKSIDVLTQSLEEIFMGFYGGDDNDKQTII